eukprot:tig00001208_g7535.t1
MRRRKTLTPQPLGGSSSSSRSSSARRVSLPLPRRPTRTPPPFGGGLASIRPITDAAYRALCGSRGDMGAPGPARAAAAAAPAASGSAPSSAGSSPLPSRPASASLLLPPRGPAAGPRRVDSPPFFPAVRSSADSPPYPSGTSSATTGADSPPFTYPPTPPGPWTPPGLGEGTGAGLAAFFSSPPRPSSGLLRGLEGSALLPPRPRPLRPLPLPVVAPPGATAPPPPTPAGAGPPVTARHCPVRQSRSWSGPNPSEAAAAALAAPAGHPRRHSSDVASLPRAAPARAPPGASAPPPRPGGALRRLSLAPVPAAAAAHAEGELLGPWSPHGLPVPAPGLPSLANSKPALPPLPPLPPAFPRAQPALSDRTGRSPFPSSLPPAAGGSFYFA